MTIKPRAVKAQITGLFVLKKYMGAEKNIV